MKQLLYILYILFLLEACRDDVMVVPPMTNDTSDKPAQTEYLGMYILCEGNMGSNKCTLDFLDFSSGQYIRNIYPSRNPASIMELGDVGNDIKIYGSKLWMVINCSNKIEVADAMTTVSQGHIDIPNCRFIAFDAGFAYVSSYVGRVGGASVIGSVYKVDTLSLQVVDRVDVGYQPDELTVLNGCLYIANSGGYNAMQGAGYDHTVSVIDLSTFKVIKTINVAPNLFRIRSDHHGQLWVASRGDYMAYPSRLYIISGDQVTDSLDIPVSDMAFRGDSLLYYGSSVDIFTGEMKVNYGIIDVTSHRQLSTKLIDPETKISMPYGLMVHPATGDLYVMDATNFVSSGKLFCFNSQGHFKWQTWTGDIPGHAVWLKTTK